MRTSKFLVALVLGGALAFTATSCTSDETTTADAALTTTATDEAQAAAINDEIISLTDSYTDNSAQEVGKMSVKAVANDTVPSVTLDSMSLSQMTITIDFGTTGITGKRGNTLKGKLIVTFNYIDASKTIRFNNFYINDIKISGSKTITYEGLNAKQNPTWTINVNDTITRADGTKVVWISERTRERIDNNNTPKILWDDKYAITGTSHGINASGKEYSMVIDASNPLIAYNNYRHFVKGSVTITTEKRTAVLDYGDGTRDNKATITINGNAKEITLK